METNANVMIVLMINLISIKDFEKLIRGNQEIGLEAHSGSSTSSSLLPLKITFENRYHSTRKIN